LRVSHRESLAASQGGSAGGGAGGGAGAASGVQGLPRAPFAGTWTFLDNLRSSFPNGPPNVFPSANHSFYFSFPPKITAFVFWFDLKFFLFGLCLQNISDPQNFL